MPYASLCIPDVLHRLAGKKKKVQRSDEPSGAGGGELGPTGRAMRRLVSDREPGIRFGHRNVRPDHRRLDRLLAHAAGTSSSARCLSEVSSNERCTWSIRGWDRR
jgi:hypothetical protein